MTGVTGRLPEDDGDHPVSTPAVLTSPGRRLQKRRSS